MDAVAAEGIGRGGTLGATAVAEVYTRPGVGSYPGFEVCNPAGTGAVVGIRPVALEVGTHRGLEVCILGSAVAYSPVPEEVCIRDSVAACSPGSAGDQVDYPQTAKEECTAVDIPLHAAPTAVRSLPDPTSILPVLTTNVRLEKLAQAHSNHQDSLEPELPH